MEEQPQHRTDQPAEQVTDELTGQPVERRRPRGRRRLATALSFALVVGVVAPVTAYAAHRAEGNASTSQTTAATSTAGSFPPRQLSGAGGWGVLDGPLGGTGASDGDGTVVGGSDDTSGGSAADPSATAEATQSASSAQSRGVVTVVSTLQYQSAVSAGTGIVLTADGEVLTNNHVVEGATSIEVTDQTTGRTYTASVVGTDAADDIAVLHLDGASDLSTASVDVDGTTIGEAVTAVGNAGGTGALVAAVGTLTAADQSITTQPEGVSDGEDLTGLLETSADVVSGDSGGPLLDADGQVIGIDTAATAGGTDPTGYAIPIATAIAVAAQITSGDTSGGAVLGLPAFLGVERSSLVSGTGSSNGALVAGVVKGTPAEELGLAAGDVVTAIDGTVVTSGEDLSRLLAERSPGEDVSVTWVDAAGVSHSGHTVLASGPAA